MIKENAVFRLQLIIFDLVFDEERQLSFIDGITSILAGIGRERSHLDALDFCLQIQVRLNGKRVNLCHDRQRGRVVITATKIEIGDGAWLGGQTGDTTTDFFQICGVVGFHKVVSETYIPALQSDLSHFDRHCRFVRNSLRNDRRTCLAFFRVFLLNRYRRLSRSWHIILSNQLHQIKFAFRADDDARKEIRQRDFPDRNRHRIQTNIDVTDIKRFPTQKIRRIDFIDRQEVSERCLAGECPFNSDIRACRLAQFNIAVRRHLSARYRNVQLFRKVGLERQKFERLDAKIQIRRQIERIDRTLYVNLAALVDFETGGQFSRLGTATFEFFQVQVERLDIALERHFPRIILQSDRAPGNRKLTERPDHGRVH